MRRRAEAGLNTSWPGRIAFVHIPKTGGSAVIKAFEQALGEMRCSSWCTAITDDSFRTKMFVAGHVQLSEITPRAFAFTFLRHPLQQIVSHLRWIDRYTMPEHVAKAALYPAAMREAIARIARTDFADAQSLGRFFNWLPEDSPLRLRNVQCEVLAAEADRVCYTNPAEMAAAAVQKLDHLDFVGLSDRLNADLVLLFQHVGIRRRPMVEQVNPAPSPRRIDLADPAIKRVLERQVAADMVLYTEVVSRRRPVTTRIIGRTRRVAAAYLGLSSTA